jgi:hypothetical protein
VRRQGRINSIRLFRSMLIYYRKTGTPAARLGSYLVYAGGYLRNELLYSGVAVKRLLRKAGLVK